MTSSTSDPVNFTHVTAVADYAFRIKEQLAYVNEHSFNNFQLRAGIEFFANHKNELINSQKKTIKNMDFSDKRRLSRKLKSSLPFMPKFILDGIQIYLIPKWLINFGRVMVV